MNIILEIVWEKFFQTICMEVKQYMNFEAKNKAYKSKDIKADMKLKKLKGKEYIHSIGMWSEYLNYLKKEISTWKE